MFECESEKNTNKKQLADAMVFLRETINEQEVLLHRAAGDGRNDASAAMLSASISARVKALTEHLKVPLNILKIFVCHFLITKLKSFMGHV